MLLQKIGCLLNLAIKNNVLTIMQPKMKISKNLFSTILKQIPLNLFLGYFNLFIGRTFIKFCYILIHSNYVLVKLNNYPFV